eukprot:gene4199-2993_t
MDQEFDQLCADLFNGDFDHFASFDFGDFDAQTGSASASSNKDQSKQSSPSLSPLSGSKRSRDETSPETVAGVDFEAKHKADELMKDQRLNAITDFIHALNQCENESIERLLREEYDEDVVVRINHVQSDVYHGRNAMLLIWVATHEAYPDGMFKVLEKRYINMTVPRGKAGAPPNASPKVEFVYKFSGTKIMPGNLNTLVSKFVSKHEDYGTYGPEKLNDKLLQFVAMSDMAFESESSENFIGEATLTFVPDTTKVKEITFNILAFDGTR